MANGNNRAGEQPRAYFRQVGGTVIKFRHPYFAGVIDTGNTIAIDEIDVSKCVKLEGRFFEANQNQDSAKQVLLIDGSTVTITNRMLNGTITIPAVPTTGEVPTGDFIAGCQLIKSVGDTVGGLLTKTDFVGGKALTKIYYGVTVQQCPDDVSEGNDVGVYTIKLLYAGWIQAESSSTDLNKKAIWAVGSTNQIDAFYNQYTLQAGGTGKASITGTAVPNGTDLADNITSDNNTDNSEEATNAIASDGAFSSVIKDGTTTKMTT